MKRKANHPFWIILFLILLGSCSSEKPEIIELNNSQNKKLILDNTYHIIQLERNSNSLLEYIMKVFVDFKNDRIFILSDNNVFFYTSGGKYLTKLSLGGGPGEITDAISFAIDSSKKIVYVNDNYMSIITYNYNGKLIDKYSLNGYYSNDISIFNDENLFLLCNSVGFNEKHFIGMYNLSERKVVKKLIPDSESKYPHCKMITNNNFTQYDGQHFFYSSNIMGIFKYVNSDFKKVLTFDFGNRSVPSKFAEKFKGGNTCDFQNYAKSRNFIPYLYASFPYKGYFFIVADDEKTNCYAVDMKNREMFYNGPLYTYFNLPNKETLRFPCGIQDELITFQCNATDFFESTINEDVKEIQIAGYKLEIKQDDNPILIVVQ